MWLETLLIASSTILSLLPGATTPPKHSEVNRNISSDEKRGIPKVSLVLGPRTPINPPNVGYHGEIMAAADPESADTLIVCGYRANQRTGSGYEGYVYQSSDQGKTWSETLVDGQSQWVSEESCAFGPSHQAYFASGVSDTSHGEPHHEYGNLFLYRSADGGSTWRPVLENHFMDFTSMAIDSTRGRERGTVYLFANTMVDPAAGGWRMMDKAPYLAAFRDAPELNFSVVSGSFNSGKPGAKLPGMYPSGSAVLKNGTVLAIFPADGEAVRPKSATNERVFPVEVGISRDGGKSLQKSVIYESADPAVATGLAVDERRDEIYVCWTPRYAMSVSSRLMLATSSDQGRSWSVKPVGVPEEIALDLRVGSVSIAINKDGVLGFLWYGKNADRVYFGVSFDGGDSIASVLPLSPNPPLEYGREQPQADERRLFVYPPVWKNSSQQLEPVGILLFGPDPWGVPFGNALVSDKSGIFHPVWSEVANGETNLWTRAVSIGTPARDIPNVTTAGLSDISDRVVWHVSNVRYDHISNLVVFDITVANKSDASIQGPIVLVLASPSGQPEVSADNADNGELGEGALWKLRIPAQGLQCGHAASPRTLSFHTSVRGEDIVAQNKLICVALKIYGRLPGK